MRLALHANATHASQNETQNRKQNPKPTIWTPCWRYFVEGVGSSGGPQDDFAGIRQQGIKHIDVKTQVTTGKWAPNRKFLTQSSFLQLVWAARFRAPAC